MGTFHFCCQTCILVVIQLFLPPFATFQWKRSPSVSQGTHPWALGPTFCLSKDCYVFFCFFSWMCRSLSLLLLSVLNTLRSLFIFEKRRDKASHDSRLLCPAAPPHLLPARPGSWGQPPHRLLLLLRTRALFPPLLHVNWKPMTPLVKLFSLLPNAVDTCLSLSLLITQRPLPHHSEHSVLLTPVPCSQALASSCPPPLC